MTKRFQVSGGKVENFARKRDCARTDVFVHHSSVSLEERKAAEDRFHHGRNAVIVCTSTLELGIDVGDLDKVLQADAPSTVSSFLQRMGRTGRRQGQRANTTFFCEDRELVLQAAALVEMARAGWVESVPVQTRCWPVLVHQLLAMSLEFGAVSPERCWAKLSRVPDFSGVSRQEFDQLVEHLIGTDYLFLSCGLLSMGDQAERVFGRKNFMDLYAVFSSPQLYTVVSQTGKAIGSLEQTFVDKLVEGVSCFLLGGRAWTVELIKHSERTVVARRAPAGRKPGWGGYIPQFLGFDLCQKMAALLASDERLPYLDEAASAALATMRNEIGPLLSKQNVVYELTPDGEYLWTFAGGAVNQTLKYGFQLLRDCNPIADNFRLRFPSEDLSWQILSWDLDELSRREFWDDPETQERLLKLLPEYRLSKFQRALPRKWSEEMVRDYLVDIDTTLRFLGKRRLHPEAIPQRGDSAERLNDFALSFEGYRYWGEDWSDRWNRYQNAYHERGELPDDLDELRACLFITQRAHRHGGGPGEDFPEFFYGLLEQIRRVVSGSS